MSEVNIIEKLYDFGIDRQEMIKHGFSAQKFDDVQRGKSSYNIDDLILISETFDLSLDYLVGRIPKSSEMLRSPHKETLTRKNACCPFCGSNNIWATIQTIISCSRKQPVYSDGIDCIDNDNEGDEPISGNTLGGISRQSVVYYAMGDRLPKISILVALAKLFNTSTDFLLGLTNERYVKG